MSIEYSARQIKWHVERQDNNGDLRSISTGGPPDEDMVGSIAQEWAVVMIKKYAQGPAGLGKALRVESITLNKSWPHDQEVDVTLTISGNNRKAALSVRVTTYCGSAQAPTSLLCQIVDRSGTDPKFAFSTIGAVSRKTDQERWRVVTAIQLTEKASCP
jgi:hypothetical protein